ncbi:septum formation family protein [Cellulosimicrobium cellulans]|uniref:septum formation family protein n=1 Tax=Cellulosimicrobium cellulans TaxID=1710 RepID=UPI0020985D9B|nr:septum formation family protein [Cellulosimicrobium cellulans]MCO7273924.1 septum formation family protein [Cellulosimicrobium cellulans]
MADDDLFAPPGGPTVPPRPTAPVPPPPAGVPAPPGTAVPPPAASAAPAGQAGPGFAPETYYAPGWQPAAPRVEPLAVASVPAGLVLGPVGIGLGAAGLSRVRSRRTRGRGLAVAGMAVGAVVTLAWTAGALAWWQGEQARVPLAGDVSTPQTVNAVQLVLGTCLDELPPDGEVTQVRAVPCADEHRAQVVARTDLGADEVWPGQQAVDRRVARVCTPDVLGSDAPEGVELVVWSPTEASWRDGDRTGLCLAAGTDPLPGDLLG